MFGKLINGRWIVFNSDDSGGGGQEASGQLKRALEKHNNDWSALASDLWAELLTQRQNRRAAEEKLKEEIADLEARVPQEGQIILTTEQAESWDAYQEMGDPQTIGSLLQEKVDLQGEIAGLRRADLVGKMAQTGLNQAALQDLSDTTQDAVFSLKEVTGDDGQPLQVAMIQVGEGDPQSVVDYVAEKRPALSAALSQQQQSGSTAGRTPQWPSQAGTNGQPAKGTESQQALASIRRRRVVPHQGDK